MLLECLSAPKARNFVFSGARVEASRADIAEICTVSVEAETVEQALEEMKSSFSTGEVEIIFSLPKSVGHEFKA